MREIEVPVSSGDRLFRASRLHATVFALVCIAASAAFIYYKKPTPRIAYIVSAVILFFLWLGHRFITARFHPSNWLVRLSGEGLFIHFRSYLNERLSSEDPTVIFLPYQDIRSARLVREKLKTPDASRQNAATTQIVHWVEFELGIDPAPLVDALSTERGRPGAVEKHWYGSSQTLYQDYPVQMQMPPLLRVCWTVVPRASVFLGVLRQNVAIAPEVKVSDDFFHLQGLPREQQESRLRELNDRGQTIAAVYLAQKLYGFNLTEAAKFVDGLAGGGKS